ncbi:hypothetical protein LZ30DRAFT_107043 [Colletotrichum cereale]|nr:hypothetical protein LZ30DRAFT_107043 [Colletotrichum cereale]
MSPCAALPCTTSATTNSLNTNISSPGLANASRCRQPLPLHRMLFILRVALGLPSGRLFPCHHSKLRIAREPVQHRISATVRKEGGVRRLSRITPNRAELLWHGTTKTGNPKWRQENWHRAKPMIRLLEASLEHGPSPTSPLSSPIPGLVCSTHPHTHAPFLLHPGPLQACQSPCSLAC